MLDKVIAVYQRRMGEVAETISMEMGARCRWLKPRKHRPASAISSTRASSFDTFDFEYDYDEGRRILKEAIGVIGMITPWNWPMNQIGNQSRSGARRWLHHGAEAIRARADANAILFALRSSRSRVSRLACSTLSTATAQASVQCSPRTQMST